LVPWPKGRLLDYQQSLGARPKLIQAIVIALGNREDMDNYISIVQQNPVSLLHAFAVARTNVLLFQFFLNIAGDGLYLPVAIAATNHKIIGYYRNLTDVQQDNIFGLFVVRNFYNGTCQVNWFDKKYSFKS
jgi:hypothetical protein